MLHSRVVHRGRVSNCYSLRNSRWEFITTDNSNFHWILSKYLNLSKNQQQQSTYYMNANMFIQCLLQWKFSNIYQRRKHLIYRRIASSGILGYVALGIIDVSEELRGSFIRVTLGISSQRRSVARYSYRFSYVHLFLSPWWRRSYVPPKRRFLQEPYGGTFHSTPFFILTPVKTSKLTSYI
jgi:hypothetical protein